MIWVEHAKKQKRRRIKNNGLDMDDAEDPNTIKAYIERVVLHAYGHALGLCETKVCGGKKTKRSKDEFMYERSELGRSFYMRRSESDCVNPYQKDGEVRFLPAAAIMLAACAGTTHSATQTARDLPVVELVPSSLDRLGHTACAVAGAKRPELEKPLADFAARVLELASPLVSSITYEPEMRLRSQFPRGATVIAIDARARRSAFIVLHREGRDVYCVETLSDKLVADHVQSSRS
ncbi:MAG TPA: hypothetical protein VK427_19705 [Kofleriaceae bacterium]|nr:hypothetical protein [Kofleriaceae bacterium]